MPLAGRMKLNQFLLLVGGAGVLSCAGFIGLGGLSWFASKKPEERASIEEIRSELAQNKSNTSNVQEYKKV